MQKGREFEGSRVVEIPGYIAGRERTARNLQCVEMLDKPRDEDPFFLLLENI